MKRRKQAYGFVITLTPKQAYIFVNNDAFKHSENLEVIHETRFKLSGENAGVKVSYNKWRVPSSMWGVGKAE